jgi:hypothetical protein
VHSEDSGSIDIGQLAREFDDHLREGYRHLARTIGYRATVFNEMITMHGGVKTAQLLLRGPRTSEGFARLWEAGMLHHSVEASILRPEYRCLFSDDERSIARRRLADHQFDVESFLRRFS